MMTILNEYLRCPRCWERFDQQLEHPNASLLVCECSEYPFVKGIPVLRTDALTKLAIKYIKSGNPAKAKQVLLNGPSRLPARQTLGSLAESVSSLPSPLTTYLSWAAWFDNDQSPATFEEGIDILGNERFVAYSLYRPFEHSFWNLYAVLPQLTVGDGPILDFGGGWGHSASLIRRLTGVPTYNVEIDFMMAYYQRSYIDENCPVVVVEPRMDIPFVSNTFRAVIDLDGFHYVEAKRGIASEYERTVRNDGSICLLHAHNPELTRRGYPLAAETYRDCFNHTEHIAGEINTLKALLNGGEPPFGDPNTPIDQEWNILITQSEERPSFPTWDELPIPDLSVIVNPLYEVTSSGEEFELTRRSVPAGFEDEFSFSYDQTDPHYTIDFQTPISKELLIKGILIPFDGSYAKQSIPDQSVTFK